MWHAVQHGDLHVLCGAQWELYADVVPCRRCLVACVACGVAWGRCGTTRARLWDDEGDSLKHTAVHHRLWYHVGNSSLHVSPFGSSPTLIEHCTAAMSSKFQPEPGVSHSMRHVMGKCGFLVASPV